MFHWIYISKFTGASYVDRFLLKNPARASASLELPDVLPPDKVAGNDAELEIKRDFEAEDLFFILRRASINDSLSSGTAR
jgi:hypothetical protein